MTPDELFARVDDDICALAAAAVPVSLAAGASDAEAGAAVRADLVAHQIAGLHRFMLRLSARANDLIDWARTRDRSAGALSTKADLAAARVAATGGRLMESARHGLTALGRLRPEESDAGVFQTVTWLAGTVPDEEVKRRLEAAQAAHAAKSPAAKRSPRAQEIHEKASLEARLIDDEAHLGELCEVAAGGRPGWGQAFLLRLFGHEIAAGYMLGMRLLGGADRALDRATTEGEEPAAALCLADAAARLAGRVRRAALAMQVLGGPNGGGPNGGGPNGGGPKILGTVWIGADPELPANANDAGIASAPPEAPAAKLYASPGQARGRLANGNPSGDYLAAPRCGACTRAGTACRQPAMANGRCRFHGGKSTGAKTVQGRVRARTARLSHGGYSAEIIDLQKAATAAARTLRALVRPPANPRFPAGHGVHPLKPRRAA